MKKNLLKYIFVIIIIFILILIYLSTFGFETKIFNNQIKDKIYQVNKNLDVELKKVKLILDPLNFKINAKTIGPKIIHKKKEIQLEYIKTQISLISFLKNQIVSTKLEFSTKSIFLNDLIAFARTTSGRPELFILEKSVKNGQIIFNVKLNFDKDGKIKKDYVIKATLKEGKIKLFRNYNFEKINFSLNINNNIYNFKDINFTTNKSNFFSKNINITQNKEDFFIEGDIGNKDTILNNELLSLLNINLKNLNFLNTNYNSKNKFSFNIDRNLKIKDLAIDSAIHINDSEYKKPIFLGDYLKNDNDLIQLKKHKIEIKYKKNNLILSGSGKIKLEKNYDEIKYTISHKKNIFNLDSKIKLSQLKFKKQEFLKPFFSKLNDTIDLKNHQIEIKYDKDNLSIKGSGKIKLEKQFNDLDFFVSKSNNQLNFESQVDLEKTSFYIDFLNFKNNNKSKTLLKIIGNYNDNKVFNFNKIQITEKNNKIILENLLLDKNNLIVEIDKVNLDYFDTESKKNKFQILRKQKNEYLIDGSLFNSNKLIDNLLKNKNKDNSKIFKNDFSLSLKLNEVYIDEKNVVKNLKGKLDIKDNKIFKANIQALFEQNGNLSFTINTNENDEKITTFNSSNAKPIVDRYKFIKGFKDTKEGYLDFYSSKKNGVSNSKLVIDNFKVKEIPALAKLLALASLQGIADLLTGEGIRFTDFEMNFTNKNDLMRIQELYAIGPAISILLEGYVEADSLISLRGTLVPATTINRSIASLPVIGDLLIGKKVGEGVFGVSFKIKGPPKNLETTVNPIKTLTPRFITRTLEKIKKN
jgi:hypothetical protein